MIIYYDNGNIPLLRKYFMESGSSFLPLYRNLFTQSLDTLTGRRFRPKRLIYSRCPEIPEKEPLIVFDTKTSPEYFQWLCRNYPEHRVILWFWNPVENPAELDYLPKKVEVWSYSLNDCRQYGLNYNTPFYFDSVVSGDREQKASDQRIRPWVFFAGREKGRKAALDNISEQLKSAGAEVEIYLMPNHGRRGLIPYARILDGVKRSDILLDYYVNPDSGPSLRTMESLFFGKKLITNNRMIREYDFYRSENIYILGEENRSLKEFFDGKCYSVEQETIDRYLFTNWLGRFEHSDD